MNFSNWTPPQRDREELLDAGNYSRSQIRASLCDLRRINFWMGNAKLVVGETIALLEKRGLRRATILDVGTGSADLPIHLLCAASTRNLDLKIIALDLKPLHLHIAREFLRREPPPVSRRVLPLCADAFRLPLKSESIDLVTSSLFLHHFRAPEIEKLLNEFSRVARVGWIINDLVRHHAPILFFKTAWPVFARSRITRHDALASFRRGYTVEEMRNQIRPMNLPVENIQLKSHFFRMTLVGEKRA